MASDVPPSYKQYKGWVFQGRRIGYEVFFPEFTRDTPWEQRDYRRKENYVVLQEMNVYHVTHSEEAEPILSSGLAFTPREKEWGLDYSYRLEKKNQENFAESTYWHMNDLPDALKPLPGLYSWWSMEKPTEERSSLSKYGSIKFSLSIMDVLKSYLHSRKDVPTDVSRDILFKKAGTKRYKHEICYVIIVCVKVDPFGELDNIELDDELPMHDCGSDHENYVLAFYFPPPSFTITSDSSVTVFPMSHKERGQQCIREIRHLSKQRACTDPRDPTNEDLRRLEQTNLGQNNLTVSYHPNTSDEDTQADKD